jgi:hypothetical protein
MREQQRTGTKYQQRGAVNNNRYRNELNDNERVPTTTKSETKPSDQNYTGPSLVLWQQQPQR